MTQRETINRARALVEAGDVAGLKAMARGQGWAQVNGLWGLGFLARRDAVEGNANVADAAAFHGSIGDALDVEDMIADGLLCALDD
jgi:hypothetical protein